MIDSVSAILDLVCPQMWGTGRFPATFKDENPNKIDQDKL